jgi:hypothetical protein
MMRGKLLNGRKGRKGIFAQASAEPSLLELCRVQPKIMNVVRKFCALLYYKGFPRILIREISLLHKSVPHNESLKAVWGNEYGWKKKTHKGTVPL